MWIDDQMIVRCREDLAVAAWIPKGKVVILGSGNDANSECHVDACREDMVPVLRRYGGGGTVLLYPGCVVLSVGCWVRQHFQNGLYFKLFNQSVIDVLASEWPDLARITQRGISDLALGDRKLCGTSMFRSRNYLLYQASVIVNSDIWAINKYLAHPSKEPDYRLGKRHDQFLTSLAEIVPGCTTSVVEALFQSRYAETIRALAASELMAPDPSQFPNLLARAARGQELHGEADRSTH